MNEHPATLLRCVVERITYQNPENGYSVLKVKVKGYSDLVTLVGNLLEVPVGSVLLCRGEWKVDKRYGSQFVAATWEETMPATVYGIEKYLGSGLVKGIGPRFARAIVQRFGTETIDIIETDIERLYEVPNIGRKRVAKIRESWEKQKDIKNVMLFLQGYGVSTAYAAKIYREYGKESIEKVRENPYRLADDIWGIGFKTADGIAAKMGYEKEDPRRCRSGILYTLGQLSDEGHVYAGEEQLVKTAGQLLEAGETAIRDTLAGMLQAEDLILDKDAIYRKVYYSATADRLRLNGYALSEKMTVFPDHRAALITLTREELNRYHYQKGDTEDLVNRPLTIADVTYSVFLREESDYIKVSTRSKGDFPVNRLCKEYFNGGGHLNAAGGEFYGTLEEAVATIERAMPEFDRFLPK